MGCSCRWFGNTRVVGQNELERFREELGSKVVDPYTVILKSKKLPLSLLNDPKASKKSNLTQVETFESTFGKKQQRKRPKLGGYEYSELLSAAGTATDNYDETKDTNISNDFDFTNEARDNVLNKGQSKRIWGELHKVIDSSDVLIQVLDIRDPMGTRCKYVESMMKREKSRHKHLILLLNKCDLVPTWVTARWIKLLSKEYPTLAFHASIRNPFGKGALMQLLRQFGQLHKDKKHISVGFFGYPNVGKSSVINTLRAKRVCKAAPIAGETKVWQYVTLFRNVYLIDCPGQFERCALDPYTLHPTSYTLHPTPSSLAPSTAKINCQLCPWHRCYAQAQVHPMLSMMFRQCNDSQRHVIFSDFSRVFFLQELCTAM
jgi:nuclear GTP-binding protein